MFLDASLDLATIPFVAACSRPHGLRLWRLMEVGGFMACDTTVRGDPTGCRGARARFVIMHFG